MSPVLSASWVRWFAPLRKDVAIGGDPKFREMSHFLTSHTHQDGRVEVEGICCDGLVLS